MYICRQISLVFLHRIYFCNYAPAYVEHLKWLYDRLSELWIVSAVACLLLIYLQELSDPKMYPINKLISMEENRCRLDLYICRRNIFGWNGFNIFCLMKTFIFLIKCTVVSMLLYISSSSKIQLRKSIPFYKQEESNSTL